MTIGSIDAGGYTRSQLLNPRTNIAAMAQLISTFKGPYSISYMATLYNAGHQYSSPQPYGIRVERMREHFMDGATR